MRFPVLIAFLASFLAQLPAATAGQAAEPLPRLQRNSGYEAASRQLRTLGWRPAPQRDADTCGRGDDRCEGRPEMLSCAGTGMAACAFTWAKGATVIVVSTAGEQRDPGVTGVRCLRGC